MKFKCKDCGKIYDEKPDYCDCGNNHFLRMRTKAERDAEIGSLDEEPEKKENPLFIIIFLVIVAVVVYFILTKIRTNQAQPALDDAYLTSVREVMLKDFDPSGITNSGFCILSFEINEEGWITKREISQKSPIPEINDKVMTMLRTATIVPKPPAAYTNKPIKIEFGCIADQSEVECYSKNIVEKPQRETEADVSKEKSY